MPWVGRPGLKADIAQHVANDGQAYWLVYPEARQGRRKIRAFRDWILGEVEQRPE
jgi:hypothetical protein